MEQQQVFEEQSRCKGRSETRFGQKAQSDEITLKSLIVQLNLKFKDQLGLIYNLVLKQQQHKPKSGMRRRLFQLASSTAIFSASIYCYLYFHTKKNLQQYKELLQAGTLKDASRLSNDSFGISWGFQADDAVMNRIDSGDYLFIKFQCHQCLSVSEYAKCFTNTMLHLDEEFDSVGYAYRNADGLYILYNEFGVTKAKKYTELVGLPFIKGLTIQKSGEKERVIHKKLKQLLEINGVVNVTQINESPIQMANRINKILRGQNIEIVGDLRQLIQSEQQILVRTETNRTLRSL